MQFTTLPYCVAILLAMGVSTIGENHNQPLAILHPNCVAIPLVMGSIHNKGYGSFENVLCACDESSDCCVIKKYHETNLRALRILLNI